MIFPYFSEAEIRVRCLSDPFVEHTDITTLPSLPALIIDHKKLFLNTDSIILLLLLLYISFLLFTLGLWTVAVTEVVRRVAVYSCQLRETTLITFFSFYIQVTVLAMLRLTSQNLEIASAEPSGEPHPFSLEVLLCFPPH